MILTREAILAATDLSRETVDVPEWGGSVLVRTLTGVERDSFEQSLVDLRSKARRVDLSNIRAKLCSMAICDEQGGQVFTAGDVAALGAKSGKALDRVFSVAQRLSGFSDRDVEELAGN